MNKSFLVRHFDSSARQGNLYKGQDGDLSSHGTDSREYRRGYRKKNHKKANDWSDVIKLCERFDRADAPDYLEQLAEVLDVEQVTTFLAAYAAMSNGENSLYNGYGDDFFLYRRSDTGQFVLIPWDMDTVIAREVVNVAANPFAGRQDAPINRFRNHPKVRSRYLQRVAEILEDELSDEALGRRLDAIGSAATPAFRKRILEDVAARRKVVRDGSYDPPKEAD